MAAAAVGATDGDAKAVTIATGGNDQYLGTMMCLANDGGNDVGAMEVGHLSWLDEEVSVGVGAVEALVALLVM